MTLHRRPRARVATALATAALLACADAAATAAVRYASFRSPSLGRQVSYAVDVPPAYDGNDRRYGVVYALHGLFESHTFWERRGLAAALARMRETGGGDFLVVAVDGGRSFFVNVPVGAYEDLVTKDLIAHVESTYRVAPGRSHRALLGVSMGGYAALRIAFKDPALFAAVATHSAMLIEQVPTPEQGAGRWHMDAFHAVFGDPIDAALWAENDPLAWARTADPKTAPALSFDCGAQDRYGFAAGHRELDRILSGRGVAHRFELPPGDHGYEYVRARIETSLGFLGRALH
ncbi:MAG: hypothetical protein A2V74_06455 [Acidobacteria bacterium RBG_16_70_10]|nr:MAG: hypothetical protein A2V74_06455 [Acidobacteria bacterium RBG_16_70_10]